MRWGRGRGVGDTARRTGDSWARRWAGHPDAEWATEFTRRLHQRYADQTTMDLFFGRRLPEELLQLGLVDVHARGVTSLSHSDEPAGEVARYRMGMTNLRARSLGLGFSEEELDRLDAVLASPSVSMFGVTLVAAWARKPKPQ